MNLKLRAWYPDRVDTLDNPMVYCDSWEDIYTLALHCQYDKNIKVMLCSGLQDKDGTKIYDGDTIEVANGPGVYIFCVVHRRPGQFVAIDSAGGSWTRQLYHEPERIKVTGHIWEDSYA